MADEGVPVWRVRQHVVAAEVVERVARLRRKDDGRMCRSFSAVTRRERRIEFNERRERPDALAAPAVGRAVFAPKHGDVQVVTVPSQPVNDVKIGAQVIPPGVAWRVRQSADTTLDSIVAVSNEHGTRVASRRSNRGDDDGANLAGRLLLVGRSVRGDVRRVEQEARGEDDPDDMLCL